MLTRRHFALLAPLVALGAEGSPIELLPAGAISLTGIHLRRVMASPMGAQLLASVRTEEPQFAQFLDLSGLDPRHDLREVLIASYGTTRSLVVAQGLFDSVRLRGQLLKNGSANELPSSDLLRTADDGAIALPAKGLAFAGDSLSVREALALRGPGGARLSASLLQRAQQLSARHDLWLLTNQPRATMVSRIDDTLVDLATKYAPFFSNVVQVSGGIKLDESVLLAGEAVMGSERDASGAADMLRLLGNLVKMAPDKLANADVMGLLERLQVGSEARSLLLSTVLSPAQVLRLFDTKRP